MKKKLKVYKYFSKNDLKIPDFMNVNVIQENNGFFLPLENENDDYWQYKLGSCKKFSGRPKKNERKKKVQVHSKLCFLIINSFKI